MAIAMAEMTRQRRREPDFSRLRSLIDEGIQQYRDETGVLLTDRQLSLKINYSESAIYGIFSKGNRPNRELLISLADFFGGSREEWQEAGGYDVDNLPAGRGWRTEERDLAEWYASLSAEQKESALREARARRAARERGDAR